MCQPRSEALEGGVVAGFVGVFICAPACAAVFVYGDVHIGGRRWVRGGAVVEGFVVCVQVVGWVWRREIGLLGPGLVGGWFWCMGGWGWVGRDARFLGECCGEVGWCGLGSLGGFGG